MNLSATSSRRLAVPPLDEQLQIVDYLDHARLSIAAIVGEAKTAEDLLREYRSALISAAVTGKIDVREEVA